MAEAAKKAKFKKDDTVLVISGRERGKTGKVVKVLRDDGKLIVERINVIKRHRKASGPQNPGCNTNRSLDRRSRCFALASRCRRLSWSRR